MPSRHLGSLRNASAAAACAVQHSRSQLGEDLLLLPTLLLLAGGKPGTFVELGAFDGVTFSNTYMLERCFGWTGLLIEASPPNFAKLNVSGRGAHKLHAAVCGSGGADFVPITLDGGETAGEITTLTKRRQAVRRKRVAHVRCAPLPTLMAGVGLPRATFLSLDVEGGELKVLSNARPADFELVMVETVSGDAARARSNAAVRALLAAAGLRTWPTLRVSGSDVFGSPGALPVALPGVAFEALAPGHAAFFGGPGRPRDPTVALAAALRTVRAALRGRPAPH